jgi:Icc-related predicted phosphoesterase
LNVAAISDLHGLPTRFSLAGKLFDEGIDTLLIAGDISAAGRPEDQQANVRTNFTALLKGKKGVRIFAIPGNDDWTIVERSLKEFPEVVVPTGRAFPLDARSSVVGYPYVPVTPFMMKDYEKWDTPDEPALPVADEDLERALIERGISIFGLRSKGKELCDFEFDRVDRSDNIAADLDRAARLSDPRKTLYLIHTPPAGLFDTGIPTPGRRHIGSLGVAEFIRRYEPWLTIHGHSHEAVDRNGGRFQSRLGNSDVLSVGPGNDPTVLSFLLLDLATSSFKRERLTA